MLHGKNLQSYRVHALVDSELMGHPCMAEMSGQALPRLGSTMRDGGGFGFLF